MRYKLAVILALSIGAAASVYAPTAEARIVVAVGLPVPVYAPSFAVPVARVYGAAPYYGAAQYVAGYRRFGYYGYPHWAFGPRHWDFASRRWGFRR
jgi:hypothetical protein